jgi:hypothetical protein
MIVNAARHLAKGAPNSTVEELIIKQEMTAAPYEIFRKKPFKLREVEA